MGIIICLIAVGLVVGGVYAYKHWQQGQVARMVATVEADAAKAAEAAKKLGAAAANEAAKLATAVENKLGGK